MKSAKCRAFTLSEVLIAMIVIGIVVILTLPALQSNLQDHIFRVRKKALHARTAQAMSIVSNMTKAQSAYDFVNNNYRNHYKIELVCGNDERPIFGCNVPLKINQADGTAIDMPTSWSELNEALTNLNYQDTNGLTYKYSQPDSKSASFITDNGESINLFLNKKCKNPIIGDNKSYYAGKYACINMIYDVNGGDKPPNQIGKDIGFITVFGAQEPQVVAPFIDDKNLGPVDYETARGICNTHGFKKRIPTPYELASMFINGNLYGLASDDAIGFWSAIDITKDEAYAIHAKTGFLGKTNKSNALSVRCLDK